MNNSIKVNYYDRFRCIAEECPFSCCQEWKITVDEKTLQKWQGVKLGQSEITLCNCVEKDDDGYVISLEENKKCPFLNNKKLCNIVTELGEEFLSDTCTTFPRNLNKFVDRIEYTLDFGCPAVIDLINEHKDAIQFNQEGNNNYTSTGLYQVREMILDMIKNEEYSLTERMMMTFYCLLDLLEDEDIDEEMIDVYKSKEYGQPLVREIRKMKFNLADSFWERNELFLDIVQLYRRQDLYREYLEEISTLAEKLEEYYSDSGIKEKVKTFEAQYVAYQGLLKNYLIGEIFANCLKEDMNLEDIVMVFQWIILEYCVIKQAVFLKWLSQDEKSIDYHIVKEYIMLIARIAGYNQKDIKEYLEDSFESTILEWGHIALILGNEKM